MTDAERETRLNSAIELFNAQEFFACHDELEEIWSETLSDDRTFYQGLIHAAVALHHFSEGNLGGARKMYFSAIRYLAPFAPDCDGVAVGRLLTDLDRCFAELAAATEATATGIVLDPQQIPRLQRSGLPSS